MKFEKNKIHIVIPAFNEGRIIKEVIEEVRSAGFSDIIVVDDGSTDDTYAAAKKTNAIVLQHLINRGKGAAAKTGIEAAKILQSEIVVTMDADGQHNPKDINKMIEMIQSGYNVVLGTRLKHSRGMPFYKIIANHAGNFFTWFIYGLWVSDSQSGFRAYSNKAIQLIDTKTDRYEYDSEIIREIKRHDLKFIEIPIEVRYTQYSMGKKQKQGFVNGIKTLIKIMLSS